MDRFAFPLLLNAVLLGGLGLQACAAQPAAKGDEEAAPLMGALDSFHSPTLQGELPFGEPAPAAIRDDARFHAWDFALDGAASVRLVTGPVDGGGETDTVVYLYREGPRGWGSTIAKNDDAPGTFFSDLAVELEAGTYRVLVKGYSRWTRGPFELLGLCEGAGCPGASEPSLGAEGDDCSAELACAEGLRCEGIARQSGLGKCIDPAPIAGEGASCSEEEPCAAGLLCAGFGMCVPEWMRGSFTRAPGLAIPDADERGASDEVVAYGLATVDMGVEVEAFIRHPYPGDLLVTLSNPLGTEATVFDGEVDYWWGEDLRVEGPVLGFSGDEDVNGVWTLKVVDRLARDVGTLEEWTLTVTSRWD